jgi:D-alanine-D-alanine ligase
MKIGLTYDLRSEYLAAGFDEESTAEFDREDTIAALEKALRDLGHHTYRIGRAVNLIRRLAADETWDLVFNIAEGLNGIGREAQVPAILDVYGIAYTFSDPLVMALTLHKGMTKRVLRDAGVATSDFAVVGNDADLETIAFQPPFFIKPVAEGTGKGVTPDGIVNRREDLGAVCRKMIAEFSQPVLVEPFLPGREFTVGLIGTGDQARVLGTLEVSLLETAQPQVYSYINKEQCEERVAYQLASSTADAMVGRAEAIALDAWRVLGCRDAGRVDLRCDEQGRPQFMEVNPLAGLHPEHSDLPILCNHLGIGYNQLIGDIVLSAESRIHDTGFSKKISHAHHCCP